MQDQDIVGLQRFRAFVVQVLRSHCLPRLIFPSQKLQTSLHSRSPRLARRRLTLLSLALLLQVVLCAGASIGLAQEAKPRRSFLETGHSLGGPFLDYWEQHGGLPIFGYPISEELWEDGRLVQYFERNRFELHPANAPGQQVLLGRLGEDRLRASGRDWWSLERGRPTEGCRFFAETEHSLCGDFLAYWEQHGGLPIFGYPLSEPAYELSETDGQIYLVQYFERNRFELHPELLAPYRVLLGLLGSWRAGWLLGESAALPASAVRAAIAGPHEVQLPLMVLTLAIWAPGYSGPAELLLFDGAGRLERRFDLWLEQGAAAVTLIASGDLGPHPAVLLIDGRVAGISGAAYQLDAQTSLETGLEYYDNLLPRVREMLGRNVLEYQLDGRRVRGYRASDSARLWLRDHIYQALGYRYFERDMTSLLDYFRRAQQPDGSFEDYMALSPQGELIHGRQQLEADLEYLYVQGVYQAWQATGDDSWLLANQEAMERGVDYSTSHPWRWDPALGLIKRPFTIDTWDFEYGGPTIGPDGQPSPRMWIDQQTRWGIMHGDNTGMAYAMGLLARIEARHGRWERAAAWQARSQQLMQRLNALSWNGSFFTHHVLLQPFDVPGVDESLQLSLSNAYALNRELLSPQQARAILAEYRRRQARGGAFAEWYSIDPPFPPGSFGSKPGLGDQPGEYVNGGIMPLVGGELARGAFAWGQERYGFDILRYYYKLIRAQGGSYLWYFPAGNPGVPGDETINSDGWGAAAMLLALTEGAGGARDRDHLFFNLDLAPRWSADPEVMRARMTLRYAASYGYLSYAWERLSHGLRLQVTATARQGRLRLLLPAEAGPSLAVRVNGASTPYHTVTIEESRYVELPWPGMLAELEVTW